MKNLQNVSNTKNAQNNKTQNNYQSLSQRAARLKLLAFSIAQGLKSGSFRSMFKGHGIEFTGVRDYLVGDDIRSIDWNVTARMNKPYVKLFEERRELVVFILVDNSESMQSGFLCKNRFEVAKECASLLCFASNQINCPLGMAIFDGKITFSSSPKAGQMQLMTLLQQLDNCSRNENKSKNKGTALSNALQGAYRILKNRSLVIIISDFRATNYEQHLALLKSKHDVLAIRITDPSDTELPKAGYFSFEDPETKIKRNFPLFSNAFLREWKKSGKDRSERFLNMCAKRGIFSINLSTKDDPAQVLERFFCAKEKR